MKRVIIIVLVLMVVVGGGAGGLMMLGIVKNPFRSAPKAPDVAAQEAADAEAKAQAANLPISALPIVKVPDLVIPVLVGDTTTRRVFLNIRLVAKAGGQAPVKAGVGQGAFQNAMLSDLIPYFQDYFRTHDLIDIQVLKSKLQQHAHDVFGDGVRDVLLVNVFESGGPVTDPTSSAGSGD
jgi:hypothetical protein